MGQTVTQPLTLRHFVDQYLSAATETRILTRCVSSGPLQWLLHGLPPTARLSIMTRSIPPDLKAVMDTALGTDPECWGDLPPRVVPPFKLELESFEVQPIPATS